MKNIFYMVTLLLIFSCRKQQDNRLDIIKLTDLDKYQVTKVRINDSIAKLMGVNENYLLSGNINIHDGSRQNWWKIKNKINGDEYEIEYINFDKQFENQIKIYNNHSLNVNSSKFYTISSNKNECNIRIHFQESNFETTNIEFAYTISDTIKKKIIKEGELDLKKNKGFYSCNIPINKNESVIGIVTRSSNLKQKDSVVLAIDRMFIK
jgi:hypothetical protein